MPMVEGSGPWIVFFPPRLNLGLPPVAVTSGTFTYGYDAPTRGVTWSGHGALRDICAELG